MDNLATFKFTLRTKRGTLVTRTVHAMSSYAAYMAMTLGSGCVIIRCEQL